MKTQFSSLSHVTLVENITARLAQLAAKQAKEIVRSQRKRSKRKRRMPKFRKRVANLDSRFFTLSPFNGHFDWALVLKSGLPRIVVPFNNTKHTLKFLNDDWVLANSIRLGSDKKGVWIEIIFEKPRPSLKEEGEILGVDIGYRCLLATSRGEMLGTELRDKIEKAGKRRKGFHYYISTEINRVLKKLDLRDVKILVIENLKNVRCKKRGKFSRKVNRLLSFWHYARVINRLRLFFNQSQVT